ncbi:hypothetical protein ACIP20_08140 [Marinilactibacillus psychrotolerans]
MVEYIEPLNNEDMAAVVQIIENIFKLWKLMILLMENSEVNRILH